MTTSAPQQRLDPNAEKTAHWNGTQAATSKMQTCGRQGHLFGLWKENNKVTILIDADGCPVVDLTVQTAARYKVPVLILCDTAHQIQRDGAQTLTFDKVPTA